MHVPDSMTALLLECTCMSVSFCWRNIPYCANCFFAWDQLTGRMIFKSDSSTRHIHMLSENIRVAGTVLPDIMGLDRIRGLQFVGLTRPLLPAFEMDLQSLYYKKYPYATEMEGKLWVIVPQYFKLTDNSIGFGTKIEWGRLPHELKKAFP